MVSKVFEAIVQALRSISSFSQLGQAEKADVRKAYPDGSSPREFHDYID